MDLIRKELDELMGKSRNKTKEHYDDPEVQIELTFFYFFKICKFYLVSVCPFDFFANTKYDLGK